MTEREEVIDWIKRFDAHQEHLLGDPYDRWDWSKGPYRLDDSFFSIGRALDKAGLDYSQNHWLVSLVHLGIVTEATATKYMIPEMKRTGIDAINLFIRDDYRSYSCRSWFPNV